MSKEQETTTLIYEIATYELELARKEFLQSAEEKRLKSNILYCTKRLRALGLSDAQIRTAVQNDKANA